MSLVTLVSGGLDSTLMAVMAKKDGLEQHPLFIDYGQRAAEREWQVCRTLFRTYKLPKPTKMDVSGFGNNVSSGLTDTKKDLLTEAFLPGRNMLFLLCGAAFAATKKASGVCIGLLDENQRIFEDQSASFLTRAEAMLRTATASQVSLAAPLIKFSKKQVLALAAEHGVKGTYSCHSGKKQPCGKCISCLERQRAEDFSNGR